MVQIVHLEKSVECLFNLFSSMIFFSKDKGRIIKVGTEDAVTILCSTYLHI